MVTGYTRESGVRGLEKKLAQVVRYAAKSIAMEEEYNLKISDLDIESILGPSHMERDKYETNEIPGVVTGLAWTSVGGDILFIESILSKGKGTLSITGNLGKVIKEENQFNGITMVLKKDRFLNVKVSTTGQEEDLDLPEYFCKPKFMLNKERETQVVKKPFIKKNRRHR